MFGYALLRDAMTGDFLERYDTDEKVESMQNEVTGVLLYLCELLVMIGLCTSIYKSLRTSQWQMNMNKSTSPSTSYGLVKKRA